MSSVERIPPQDPAAEAVVLGAMMLSGDAIAAARQVIGPDDFYAEANGTIFRCLTSMSDTRKPVDLVTVPAELRARGELDRIGGIEYLDMLVNGTPDPGNAAYYAGIVRDKSRKRRLILRAFDWLSRAYADRESGEDLLADVQGEVYKLGLDDRHGGGVVLAGTAVRDALDHTQRVQEGKVPPGILTGLDGLDDATGGFQPGDLVTLAGATGGGKSALALTIAENIAARGGTVLYVSAEMEARELGKRLVQARSNVWGSKIRQPGCLTPTDWIALDTAAAQIDKFKVALLARRVTVGEIAMHARRLAGQWGKALDLIVVDYLQLMAPTGGDTRAQQVGGVAWGLKGLALELGTPILMLSQFDRGGVKQDGPPTIHHLKESGDIENHSNAVLLLHRPATAAIDPFGRMEVWCKIGKARDGAITPWDGPSAIRLIFDPGITRFVGSQRLA